MCHLIEEFMVIFDTSIVTCRFTMRDGKIVQSSLDILSSIAVYEVTIRMSYGTDGTHGTDKERISSDIAVVR